MHASDIRLRVVDDQQELSAILDGFHLWYRFPLECPLALRGDPFVAAGLLPAMLAGENLVIDDAPVSAQLLAGVERIQQIFHRWNPAYQIIEVQAETAPATPLRDGVASFFSGGVDGTYTFTRHAEEISHLVFVRGIDMQVENQALFEQAFKHNQGFAAAFGKTLLPVTSNLRRFCHPRGIPWRRWYSGAGLASIALALGFPRTYVASTNSYEHLEPDGSHPLLDPLWSTEGTRIIHDGCEAGRGDKLRCIANTPGALAILRVCWHDEGYNCGRCEKCLRTMLALRLLGVRAPTLPALDDLREFARLRVESPANVIDFNDNRSLALQVGDTEVVTMLERMLKRFRIRRALIDLDDAITGGWCKRAYLRLRSGAPKAPRQTLDTTVDGSQR